MNQGVLMQNNIKKISRYGSIEKFNLQQLSANFIKERLPPFDFYQHELPDAILKKNGWNAAGLCPFHRDTKVGSFHVNLMTGSFICFSCGSAGSDIIAFVMNFYGLRFYEALAKLVDDWGLYE